jgi:hypothetical protein
MRLLERFAFGVKRLVCLTTLRIAAEITRFTATKHEIAAFIG